jgi:hypothetical protein
MARKRAWSGLKLKGLVTDVDLPEAEQQWPGLQSFLDRIPAQERPSTFLELMWRFECWRAGAHHAARRPTKRFSIA